MFFTTQLEQLNSGKVRDAFRVDDSHRLIVCSDRLSCFNDVLETPIPGKGAILSGLANAWFEKTRHIIDNHFIKAIDPNISLVREAEPIRVEMIVRGYLCGSAARRYRSGERYFSGVKVPDGMDEGEAFSEPIVTPTTKDLEDRPITPEEIVSSGLVDADTFAEMTRVARELFLYGQEVCAQRELQLIDTKYEFGFIEGKLCLIDELHTPDSSRFRMEGSGEWMDKEFIRQWLLSQDPRPNTLPGDILQEAVIRYRRLYERLLGEEAPSHEDQQERMVRSMVASDLIRDGVVVIVMGSERDLKHGRQIQSHLEEFGVAVQLRVASAHKNGEAVVAIAEAHNRALEPTVFIAVAGRSNGLGGALAANLAVPVINCPPFKDKVDFLVNVNSSLVLPSYTPASTVLDPVNAAEAALRALNLPRLRRQLAGTIEERKRALREADAKLQQEACVS